MPIQTKTLLRQRKRLKVLNKLLYRRIKSPGGVGIYQFVVPETFSKIMLDSVHSVGYQGRDRMLEVLKTRCFWTGVTADVEDYCKERKRCSVSKPPYVKIQ